MRLPCDGAAGLAVKMFIWMKPEFSDCWAPLPISDAAAIIHEDAELIDADMDVQWVRGK